MERTLCTSTVSFLLNNTPFVSKLRAVIANDNVTEDDIAAVAEVLQCYGAEIQAIIEAVAR